MAKKVPKIVREIKKFVPHEINYAFDRQLSFSQIQVYNDCPHRWKLQYVDKKKLFIDEVYADEGPKLKRIRPRAQGRAYRIVKPTCHITVVVKSKN